MARVRDLFDYIYYRIYKFSKERADVAAETNGTLLLSLMQFATVFDFILLVRMIFPFDLPGRLYLLPLLAVPAILNWIKYERSIKSRLAAFDLKWKDEDVNAKVRNGWIIGTYLVAAVVFPFVVGFSGS
jgi:hypothetical protein